MERKYGEGVPRGKTAIIIAVIVAIAVGVGISVYVGRTVNESRLPSTTTGIITETTTRFSTSNADTSASAASSTKSDIASFKNYKSGSVSDSHWENEYFNLSFDLPKGWIMTPAGSLDKLNKLYRDNNSGELIEMVARKDNGDKMPVVGVQVFDSKVKYPDMSVDEIFMSGFENGQTYGAAENTDIGDIVDYTLAGEKYRMLNVIHKSEGSGKNVELRILMRKEGDNIISITCSAYQDEAAIESILSAFRKLK